MKASIALLVAFAAAAPLTASLTAPLAAQTTASNDAIDRAATAWSKVKTLRGTFEQTIENSLTGGSDVSRGEFSEERPNRLAIRFNPPSSGEVVSDGHVVWIYLPASAPGQVVKRPATEQGAVPIDLAGQFLDAPRRKYEIAPADARTVDGHAAHGFVLAPRKGSGAPFTKATVWIDDDDSLIREFEETEPNGVTRHIRITTLELNPAIDRGSFTFTVPAGVKVIDQTRGGEG